MKFGIKTLFCVSVIILIIGGCEKSPDFKYFGSWVETIEESDTIVFDIDSYSRLFYLDRGTELRNGYLVPRAGSGIYYYELSEDSISVMWGLSSSIYMTNWYIELSNDEESFKIGKFYPEGPETEEDYLVFRKIN
ncbi:MAG: hypothetical protein QNK33_02215 [Bacteroidales bacterium]|nr:hypothetical protein [Bacteroidales bacterium]